MTDQHAHIGGFGAAMNQTAAKLREVIDLDRASADEIRRWTLVGIVDLSTRMGQIEKLMEKQDQFNSYIQRLALGVGALAWIGLLVATIALTRHF